MAKNVKINGVTYENVPQVSIPLAAGSGTADFYDTSAATAAAAAGTIVSGKTAYVNGAKITGSLTSISVSQDSLSKVLTVE